jgi:rhamnopyranosyl-N-acetylglucosaminyl-diphospho-decaprenol beta-1,3/1,4-galactofuranosyltransferase
VLATYNRRAIVLRCVELLQQQTQMPEKICVVDNGSSDGTSAEIRRIYGANERVDLIDLPKNLGNAGGVRIGMEKAFDAGADAIWILDDDAWPRPDALEKLLAHFQPDTVCSSLVLDPEKEDLAWACVLASPQAAVVDTISALPREEAFEVRGAWLGALVPRHIMEDAGFPDPGFFIRGEDEEYPARIGRRGYRFFCVRASVLEHPTPGKSLRFQLFGLNIFYEPGLAPWKAYYVVRNRAYLHRKFASTPMAGFLKAWGSVLFFIIMAIAIDDHKCRRVAKYLKGGWRGYAGRLGDESRPG